LTEAQCEDVVGRVIGGHRVSLGRPRVSMVKLRSLTTTLKSPFKCWEARQQEEFVTTRAMVRAM
jgi:hypothetical protein